jgi:phosphoribosylglycinamide formyltransferase-1
MAEQLRNIAVFASGQGTNFQAIADAVAAGELDVELKLLVCDKPGAPVIGRAERAGVETFVFRPKDYASKADYEREILGMLRERGVELIVLAGYMRLVSPVLTEAYRDRIINVHPSLLPAFPGKDAVGQALRYGVKLTGVTIHFVDDGLDSGPVIAQEGVPVLDDDTPDTLLERIHRTERRLLLQAIGWLAAGRVRLDGRKVTVS